MSSPAPVPHRVVVLAIAPVVGFDMAIPTMTFGAARDEAERPLYDVQVVGLGGREVATTVGYGVRPQGDESALAAANAYEGLVKLISQFDHGRPYTSRTAPQFVKQYMSDYDHLARVFEWSTSGEEDGE